MKTHDNARGAMVSPAHGAPAKTSAPESNMHARSSTNTSVPVAVDFAKPAGARVESPAITSSLDNRRGSSDASSNAQRWFDRSNNNPRQSSAFQGQEVGTPFHLPTSSTTGSQQQPPLAYANAFQHPMMLPLRAGLPPQLPANDEYQEEYRSVIDDLTVRNKRLRAKLRRYEQNKEALDTEKLIEVKIHGLSASKKRELEETLKAFVKGLDRPMLGNHSSGVSEPTNVAGLSTIAKPGSSHTSTKFADSGYGSLATSHQGLPQRGALKPSGRGARFSNSTDASTARNRSIQSYLHDIPEGLLPRQAPAVMTQDARKKLVVSRLEQLFSGRGAAVDGHQQPMQQQEVSQLAARDDRSAIEARGQRAALEGKREAPMMTSDTDDSIESLALNHRIETPNGAGGKHGMDKTAEVTQVEQRPTRPLDLDPHRAQDPSENIEYLQHLGFKFVDHGDEDAASDAGHGWLYLNIVMNMAQLHTLNVTPGLVKDAVKDYSSRFELSSDGRKIRWREKPLSKTLKSESLIASSTASTNKSSSGDRSRKRMRPIDGHASSSLESVEAPSSQHPAILGSSGRSYNVPTYLSQPGLSELAEDSEMADYQSMPSWAAGEDPTTQESSAWTSSGNVVSRPVTQRRHGDGPIVFYKQQIFFTDLSGDQAKSAQGLRSNYFLRPVRALGTQIPSLSRENSNLESTSASIEAAASHASLDVNADAASVYDHSTMRSDSKHVSFVEPQEPYFLEASGLGGVYPDDNFVMYVTRELEAEDEAPPVKRRKLSKLQEQLCSSLPEPPRHVTEQLTGLKGQLLEPSPLPPPNFAVSDDGSDSASEEDEDEEPAPSSYKYTEGSAIVDDDGHDSSVSSSSSEQSVTQSEEPTQDGMEEASQGPDDEAAAGVASLASENDSESSSVDNSQKLQRRLRNLADARDQSTSRSRGRPSVKGFRQASSRSDSIDLLAHARQADPQAIREREREYDAELAERLAEEMPAGSSAATHRGKPGSGCNSPSPEDPEVDQMDVDAYQGQGVERSVSN